MSKASFPHPGVKSVDKWGTLRSPLVLSPAFWCPFREPGQSQSTRLRAVLSLQVYLAAGTVYGLEGQLSELEGAARCIHSSTGETELADLEDQVAAAAAQVHHAELQVSPSSLFRLE